MQGVYIDANENPLGPSDAARKAIADILPYGGRYGESLYFGVMKLFAEQMGVPADHVMIYGGSSDPLHFTVLSYTSPSRSLVVGNPTYEAAQRAAEIAGAKIHAIPLAKDYSFDTEAMVKADPNAGVIYICNPNNPTGTVTSKEQIDYAVANKPAGSILLIDEAYIHLSDSAVPAIDHVKAGKDVIILRTFSKIYGMAGIRCGFAVARPDLLAKLQPFGQNSMPVTASAAARVSLLDADLVPVRKKIIGDTRRETIAWLKESGYKVIGDPQTNCFMIDTGRNGRGVIASLKAKNIYIGRTWPVWPDAVRVSVGTPEEMGKFRTAFKEVMDAPALAFAPQAEPRVEFPHFS
jgi:histidinol-phosphate aminotransferase